MAGWNSLQNGIYIQGEFSAKQRHRERFRKFGNITDQQVNSVIGKSPQSPLDGDHPLSVPGVALGLCQ